MGFLCHNWAPARVFMGDVGSTLLGFCFGAIPLLLPEGGATAVAVGWLLVWPFVLDTAGTLARRVIRGDNLLQAHKMHLYQIMAQRGIGHRKIAGIYGLCSAIGCALGVVLVS